MYRWQSNIVYCFVCLAIPDLSSSASVEYAVIACRLTPQSRLGDHLLAYAKAKWFSYEHAIPLLYEPFPGSSNFKLHERELLFSSSSLKFDHLVKIRRDSPIKAYSLSTLFKVCIDLYVGGVNLAWGASSEMASHHIIDGKDILGDSFFFFTDDLYVKVIENPKFAEILRQMISPIHDIQIIYPPDDILSVAVHVRTTETFGYDSQVEVKNQGLRFPGERFYVDQICNLSRALGNIPMYVFIFTDARDPGAVTDRIQKACNRSNILFDCRMNPVESQNSIEDLFSMTNFACLIRPCSHFSGVAQLIGRHMITIRPTHFIMQGGSIVIDKTDVIMPDFNGKKINYYTFDQFKDDGLTRLLPHYS